MVYFPVYYFEYSSVGFGNAHCQNLRLESQKRDLFRIRNLLLDQQLHLFGTDRTLFYNMRNRDTSMSLLTRCHASVTS